MGMITDRNICVDAYAPEEGNFLNSKPLGSGGRWVVISGWWSVSPAP